MKKVDYMCKSEFSRALALMEDLRQAGKLDLLAFMKGDMMMFDGFGLSDFEPVACTLTQLAQLIAYQALCFDGSLDQAALDEIWKWRRHFLIVGSGSEEAVREKAARTEAIGRIDKACRRVEQLCR